MMDITVNDVKQVIIRMCHVVIENEKYFCELDSVAGDGDFGMSLSKGFKIIQSQMDGIDDSTAERFLKECSLIITEYCGGATGPIWGAGFRAAAKSVKDKETLTLLDISDMFEAVVAGIQKRGGAKQGDKTLLDALIPASEALKKASEEGLSLNEAFKKAAKMQKKAWS